MARVLLIGGTGFVGSAIVGRLVDMGHEVTLFHRGHTVDDLPFELEHVLERVMNLGENRIGMRILRLDRSTAVPRFPHS